MGKSITDLSSIPYKINVVLTDNGIQFADLPKNRSGPTAMLRGHPFDRTCRQPRLREERGAFWR